METTGTRVKREFHACSPNNRKPAIINRVSADGGAVQRLNAQRNGGAKQ